MNINRTGEFKINANPRIIYQIMVQTRITITTNAATGLLRAAMIATRYSACRRQFSTIKDSEEERKLIDYQLQMDVLCKNVCAAIVIQFVV